MDILESVKLIIHLSQFFGVAPYKMKTLNGKYIFCENKFHFIYNIILIPLHIIISILCLHNLFINTGFQLRQYWISSPVYLDYSIITINIISSPIIFLKHRKIIYRNLNRLRDFQIILSYLTKSEVDVNRLKKSHNMILFIYFIFSLIIIGANIIHEILNQDYLPIYQLTFLIFAFLMSGSISLLAIQYIAYLNIIRTIYMELNKILMSHSKKNLKSDEMRCLQKIDNFLKDFIDDISTTFSFSITFLVFQTFMNTVDGTFIWSIGRLSEVVDYPYWLLYYSNFILSTTTVCAMTLSEVNI